MSVNSKLTELQNELKAPKTQLNRQFNRYYRSQEDILEAVKPLLKKYDLQLYISDDVVSIGDRFYVKANVTLSHSDGSKIVVTAYARESEIRTGMDASQLTGSSSSYARKYALNGLFLIDDTKDPDVDNLPVKSTKVKQEVIPISKPVATPKPAPEARVTTENTGVYTDMCEDCGDKIPTAVVVYSKSKFGKKICRKCQELRK